MPKLRQFGLFDFNPATGELRREGVPVKLQAQPAQVLGLLIANAGDVVTREALRKAVWGSETFVDFDRGLNFCIAQIRSALEIQRIHLALFRRCQRTGIVLLRRFRHLRQAEDSTGPLWRSPSSCRRLPSGPSSSRLKSPRCGWPWRVSITTPQRGVRRVGWWTDRTPSSRNWQRRGRAGLR